MHHSFGRRHNFRFGLLGLVTIIESFTLVWVLAAQFLLPAYEHRQPAADERNVRIDDSLTR